MGEVEMRAFATAVIAAALIISAAPANAWWTLAKWGMTVAELEQASGGTLEECKAQCRTTVASFAPTHRIRNVQAGGLTGDAWFAFDASGRLDWTILTFDEETAFGAIERALLGIYGTPIDRVRTSVKATMWRDTIKGTTIRLVDFGGKLAGTFVEYRPIANGL